MGNKSALTLIGTYCLASFSYLYFMYEVWVQSWIKEDLFLYNNTIPYHILTVFPSLCVYLSVSTGWLLLALVSQILPVKHVNILNLSILFYSAMTLL